MFMTSPSLLLPLPSKVALCVPVIWTYTIQDLECGLMSKKFFSGKNFPSNVLDALKTQQETLTEGTNSSPTIQDKCGTVRVLPKLLFSKKMSPLPCT